MALYKQTKESVTVYVKADTLTSSATKKTAEEGQKSKDTKENEDTSEKNKAKVRKAIYHTTKKAVNVAMYTLPNFAVGQFGRMTGDSNYQQMAQRKVEIAQDVGKSLLTPTFTGIGAAAMGLGPVGIALSVGTAAIGVATSLASKYEQRNMQQAVQSLKDNANANYSKARAGTDLTDGRTRLR